MSNHILSKMWDDIICTINIWIRFHGHIFIWVHAIWWRIHGLMSLNCTHFLPYVIYMPKIAKKYIKRIVYADYSRYNEMTLSQRFLTVGSQSKLRSLWQLLWKGLERHKQKNIYLEKSIRNLRFQYKLPCLKVTFMLRGMWLTNCNRHKFMIFNNLVSGDF